MPRIVALVLAYFFLILAAIGALLPVLPTVPFLLLAAWFSARGSERLHKWLYEHPHFGSVLIAWETQGAVSRKSKVAAVLMMLASLGFLYYRLNNVWILGGMTLLFVAVAIFLITRPEPR